MFIIALNQVYSRKKYWVITAVAALLLFSLNAVIRNYSLLVSQFSFKLLFLLIISLRTTFTLFGFISLVLISFLGGIVIAYSTFLIHRQLSLSAGVGVPSILTAVLAPACPSCAVGLFGILGLGGFLTFLPWKGQELSIVAIIIALLSLAYLSQKITATTCVTVSKCELSSKVK